MTVTSTGQPSAADEDWTQFAHSIGAKPRPAPIRRWVQSPNAGHLSGLLWGSGKPEIVLVHDLGDSSNGWDAVSIRLARSAVALDLPGHGRSSSASTVASPARQAPALIDAIRSFAPTAAVVVASGYGAAIALHAAVKRPQSIRAVLVIDGSPTSSGIGPLVADGSFADHGEAAAALAAVAPRRSAALIRHLAREATVVGPEGALEWRYQLGEAPVDLGAWVGADQFRDLTQPIGVVTTYSDTGHSGAGESEISDPLVRSILQRWPDTHREIINACPGDLIATSPTAVAAAIEAFAASLAASAPDEALVP